MQLDQEISNIMKVCARHIPILSILRGKSRVSMTTLAKSLSKSNPKELSRPLNELVDVEIVAYDEEDNPRGGQKLKFWSLTPFGEQILAPFFRWLPDRIPDEMKKPIGSAEQKIGLPKADPADVKFYLDRILD